MEIALEKELTEKDSPVLVSIVVRSMDRPTLGETLDSLAAQGWPRVEVILVNARGGEHSLVGERCGPFPLRLVNQGGDPLNRPQAANAGLAACNGEWIGFLDDDDVVDPDHLHTLLTALSPDRQGLTVVYSGCRGLRRDDPERKALAVFAERDVSFPRLLLGNEIPVHTFLFPAKLTRQGEVSFDESLEVYEDWDFLLQLARRAPFRFVDRITATYFLGGTSNISPLATDRDVAVKARERIYRKWLGTLSAPELAQIADLFHHEHSAASSWLAEMERQRAERDRLIGERDRLIGERDRQIGERDRQFAALLADRDAILNSRSWRVTAPLRMTTQLVERFLRRFWRRAPVPFGLKQRVKGVLFGHLPFLFFWSQAYRRWYNDNLARGGSSADQIGDDGGFEDLFPEAQEPAFVPLLEESPPGKVPVRLIAFYLPQFHPIPENDLWWGAGFTEWTNVRPASARFEGHYQPHVPGELGYYNLLDPGVQRRQVELARLYGVGGFCFYFYWFGGKRLLEQPLENYLQDRSLDLPFCICWANENWSRRWDGQENEILIAQKHSTEDDEAFIAHVARYLRDERYIRINGRPLLIVYWPAKLPSARKTAECWRKWCRDNGLGEIYLAYTQSLEGGTPAKYGFDAAIEFPPNNMDPPDITRTVTPLAGDFSGRVFDWRFFVKRSRNYLKPGYRLFRGCCPSWDNTARRKHLGTIFLHSSPAAYAEWLANAVKDTCERFDNPDERLVFVNAWNEWAEGAHLEPDQKYGYAWLDATRRGLLGAPGLSRGGKVVVVSHDAHPHGAQFLALNMVRFLREELKLEVEVVLLGSGPLRGDFAALAPVHDLAGSREGSAESCRLAADLARRGFSRAILNTTVSGWLAPVFQEAGIDSICLVHELPGVIRELGLQRCARQLAEHSRAVIFASRMVAEEFARFAAIDPSRQIICPQGLYKFNRWRFDRSAARSELRRKLGLPPDSAIVLAVGYADRRKGVDLFVESALTLLAQRRDIDFVWVGNLDQDIREELERRLKDDPDRRRLHFVGFERDTSLYYAAADVYALTSREDPFPSVVMESFDVGVPVVAFAGTGGAADLVGRIGGLLAPAFSTAEFAAALGRLLDDTSLASQLGAAGQEHVDGNLSFRAYLFDLCRFLGLDLPRVSVVVPNYNYAGYIRQRLDSIRRQSLPIYELIILDDASTDASLQTIRDWLVDNRVTARLVVNPANSGNVFAQWRKGVELAKGDYVWIAEADDLSDPDFLATVLPPLQSGETVLSYCESRQIDENGSVTAPNYHDYLLPVAPRSWRSAYVADGREEIRTALAVLNTIPNVSAVLFRREALAAVFDRHYEEIASFRKSGDWLVYLKVLAGGRIAFSPRPANRHRRHAGSVIGKGAAGELCREIAEVQKLVATEHELGDDVCVKAAAYLASLHRQFGLSADVPERKTA